MLLDGEDAISVHCAYASVRTLDFFVSNIICEGNPSLVQYYCDHYIHYGLKIWEDDNSTWIQGSDKKVIGTMSI